MDPNTSAIESSVGNPQADVHTVDAHRSTITILIHL